MKSKKISPDIKIKSIKQAQIEIEEIISGLEKKETILEHSMDQYERMIQLENHIQEQFKNKAHAIRKIDKDKKGKIIAKDHE